MKIILRKDHDKLGKIGELVEVKDGYARNYLIPREKKQHVDRDKRELQHAQKIATQLDKVSITLKVKVGEDEKLFGSVTAQMIAEALIEKGVSLDKRIIDLEEPIKALGIYTVNIKLHAEVAGKLKVWVVRE
jgi:large subunit ribosomal protein L9